MFVVHVDKLYDRTIDSFDFAEVSKRYMIRKGIHTVKDFVDINEEEFCKTRAARRSFDDCKIAILYIALDIHPVVKSK